MYLDHVYEVANSFQPVVVRRWIFYCQMAPKLLKRYPMEKCIVSLQAGIERVDLFSDAVLTGVCAILQ